MNPRCANTHICLCPCDCSQLEPLCLHRYTHKYTNFILQILLCMTPCCANSHMSVPFPVLTVRTSLHTYICHMYTYIPSQIRLYINPCCAISHLYVPLRVLTLSHLEPLCIQIFTTISICIQIFTSISIHTSYHG